MRLHVLRCHNPECRAATRIDITEDTALARCSTCGWWNQIPALPETETEEEKETMGILALLKKKTTMTGVGFVLFAVGGVMAGEVEATKAIELGLQGFALIFGRAALLKGMGK